MEIEFENIDGNLTELSMLILKNYIEFKDKFSYPGPFDIKKINFLVLKNNVAHVIWYNSTQKERWRGVDRDARLINEDKKAHHILGAATAEFWYIGRNMQNKSEPRSTGITGMRKIGISGHTLKAENVFSVYDTERVERFISILTSSSSF